MTGIPAELFYVILAIFVVVALLAVAATIFFGYRVQVAGLWGQWRAALYAYRYDDTLLWLGVPSKERASLVKELRSNIADAAAASSVPDALAGLGEPRDLARGVAAGALAPRWGVGLVWAVATFVVILTMALAGGDLFATGVAKTSQHAVAVTGTSGFLPGMTFTAETNADGHLESFGFEANLLLMLGVPLLIGLIAAAPWRAWRKNRSA